MAKVKTKQVIADCEAEFSTAQIFFSGGKLFYMVENGGARGAWDRQCGDGVWRDHPVQEAEEISVPGALAKAAEWGYDELDLPDDMG